MKANIANNTSMYMYYTHIEETCVCVSFCLSVCETCMYVRMYMCMYACTYVRTYVCMNDHTTTLRPSFLPLAVNKT